MDYVIVLLLIGLIAFVYLRLSKKIAVLNLELSENLKNEILSLIAEFNHAAEKYIQLIEERVEMAKSISQDMEERAKLGNTITREIAEQLAYMKKLKENLEREIKESEIRLKTIISNHKAILQESEKKHSLITQTYQKVMENTQPKIEAKETNIVIVEEEKKIEEPIPLQRRILLLEKEGLTHQEIAQKLQITLGEVELVIKLFKNSQI